MKLRTRRASFGTRPVSFRTRFLHLPATKAGMKFATEASPRHKKGRPAVTGRPAMVERPWTFWFRRYACVIPAAAGWLFFFKKRWLMAAFCSCSLALAASVFITA